MREARKRSESGIYHVMLRGINRQQIFIEDGDSLFFLKVLAECKQISGFDLYAYCIMGTHVHLLIHTNGESVDKIMKRIGTRFAVSYNKMHERTGHLFQDRFKSEPVENDQYFLTVLRYILHNPVKAELCTVPEQYPFSSAKEYFGESSITDTVFAEKINGKESLIEFLHTPNDDACLDDHPVRIGDRNAAGIIVSLCGIAEPGELCSYEAATLSQVIPALRKSGLSLRQISRLTGLSVGVIRKYSSKHLDFTGFPHL